MKNLIKKIRELPIKYSIILGVSLALLTTSVIYPVVSDMYNSKISEIRRKAIRDLKIDLYQQRKKIQELKKGFEDFQDNYYKNFEKDPYRDVVPKERETERVRDI